MARRRKAYLRKPSRRRKAKWSIGFGRLSNARKKSAWISRKIRILRHEGYPQRQAIAIAMRMAGVPRKRKHGSIRSRIRVALRKARKEGRIRGPKMYGEMTLREIQKHHRKLRRKRR